MRASHAVVVFVLSAGFFVRCDCCAGCVAEEESPPAASSRQAGTVYAGVGEACADDFSSEPSWGCGGAPARQTCAEGLTCCPNPTSSGHPTYVCVAAPRCATSAPAEYCSGSRDCPVGFDCIADRCLAGVDHSCTADEQCATGRCVANRCDYPLEPDLGAWPAGDAANDSSQADAGAGDGDAARYPDATSLLGDGPVLPWP